MLKHFLPFLLLSSILISQNKFSFDQFVDEGVDYYSAPFHWEEKNFLHLGLALGITYGAMQFDAELKNFTQEMRTESTPIPILVGRFYGEPLTPVVLGSYFLINSNSNRNSFQRKLGFEILQASFYSIATTQFIKMILGRERPSQTDDHQNFSGPNLFDNDFFSMPSGHTTIAFAVSTVLSENSSTDLLKILSYIPAFVTAYSRVYENRHWFSDVVLGGIIGFTTAKHFVRVHESKDIKLPEKPSTIFNISIPL